MLQFILESSFHRKSAREHKKDVPTKIVVDIVDYFYFERINRKIPFLFS